MRFAEFKPLNEATGPLKVPQTPADVTNIQRALASFNYNVQPSGKMDNSTKQAIAQAQKDIGLPPTGEIDHGIVDSINTAMTSVPGMIDYISRGLSDVGNAVVDAGKSAIDAGSDAVSKIFHTASNEKLKPLKSASALASDPEFLKKVNEVASKLGIDPNILMKIMQHESGLNPRAENKIGCVGLIQFCPKSNIGVPSRTIKNMSAIDQMDLVYKYYKRAGVTPGMTQGEIYMLTFLPWAKNKKDSTVIGQRGGGELSDTGISKGKLWSQNSPFANYAKSKGRDYYTKGDVIDYFKHYQA
jgi:peptidoglycan hydrolase-like protein with peptidoglycan-binding domain